MSNLPPGVTMAMIDPPESACQRCGRFGDECVCPECGVCGAYGCLEHLPQEELEQMAWRHRYVADSVERELRSRGLEPNPFDSMNWITRAQAERIDKAANYDDATLGR